MHTSFSLPVHFCATFAGVQSPMPPAVSSDHRTPPQLHHPQSPLIPFTTNHRITYSLPQYKPNPSPLKYWSEKTEGIHCIQCNVSFADHSHEVDIGIGGLVKLLVVAMIFCSFQFFCWFCWNCCPPHLRGPKCLWECRPSPMGKRCGCSSQSQNENPKVLLMNWLTNRLPIQLGKSKSTCYPKPEVHRPLTPPLSLPPPFDKSPKCIISNRGPWETLEPVGAGGQTIIGILFYLFRDR